MHPYLVCPSGLELTFYHCDIAEPLEYAVMGDGVFSLVPIGIDLETQAVIRVSADIAGDGTFVLLARHQERLRETE